MPTKSFNPVTPSLRWKTIVDFSGLTKTEPYKPLLSPLRKTGGRGVYGCITSRRRGGGHKQQYRTIDFYREKLGIAATVESLEYDPCRTSHIALVRYADGERAYLLAPEALKVGEEITAGPGAPVKTGNAMPLGEVPMGAFIHNVEIRKGRGGQIARSAGTYCVTMAREGGMVLLKLPSGEIRRVPADCYATIGQIGNGERENVVVGSAGRSRWLGRRPRVRGVAMNPVDHPLGGGEGRSHGGRHPVSPWGKKAKGKKTRKRRKQSNRFIVERRPKN